MLSYIFKSVAILFILMIVYHFFFEKEKMHRFNRFYLLSGLALAFITPLITVGYLDTPTITSIIESSPAFFGDRSLDTIVSPTYTLNWTVLLVVVYLVITILFLIKFLFNLSHLIIKAYRNQRIRHDGFFFVLIEESILPHTFLNFVFVNKSAFISKNIEEQLLTHETTHAHQMHSIDVILIEVLQVIFWFNPLIRLYKKAMQLNHEFLADEAVIRRHGHITEYQHLLVDKAGNNKTIYLASNLNFSVTKKRLTMMTKNTDRWRRALYAASTIPLFICLLMLFGNQAYAQSSEKEVINTESGKDAHFKNAKIVWKDENGTRVYKSYDKLNAAQKSKIMLPPPPPKEGQQSGEAMELKVLPKGSVIEYNALTNTLRLRVSGNGLAPPPPPRPPKAPGASPSPPPPPPPPPSPLDTAIDIAKNGGTFSLNGQMVDSDKVIAVLKNRDQVDAMYIKSQPNGKKLMIITTNK